MRRQKQEDSPDDGKTKCYTHVTIHINLLKLEDNVTRHWGRQLVFKHVAERTLVRKPPNFGLIHVEPSGNVTHTDGNSNLQMGIVHDSDTWNST